MREGTTKPDVEALIRSSRWVELRESISRWPAPEIADLLLELEKAERVVLFRLLPRQLSNEVFAYLEPELQNGLLRDLTDEESRQLLANLKPDDRTHLLEELPGQAIQRLLNLLSPEDLREARQLLGYPEESIGRLMTPEYIAVRQEWSVGRALEHVRAWGREVETIGIIYVTDSSWRLIDALGLEQFVLAEPSAKVADIMDRSFVALSPYEDREQAVQTMLRYDLSALPVVDAEGVLLGVVTADDVFEVAEEEATEDFQKVAAVAPLKMSYRDASIWSLYRKRVPWLLGLVVVNLAASGVIAAYETTLSAAIALAFFIPLLIDSGGNVGAQSATLMIRAMATGDVTGSQWTSSLLKEFAVGSVLGVSMGAAAWLLGLFRGDMQIALVVGLAMTAIVLVSNLTGVLLPFILVRVRLDPAVASSPLITSISDITGLMIYFGIASWLLAAMGV